MKKKFLCILVSAVFVISSLTGVVFADPTNEKLYNFNDQSTKSADYCTFNSLAGTTKTCFKDENNVYFNASTFNRMFGFESGIYGKSDSDYSEVLRVHSDTGINYTDTNSDRVYYDLHSSNSVSANDGRYYEMSLATAGTNVKWEITLNSQQFILNDSAQWSEKGWNRVGLWLNNYADDSKYIARVFVNGVQFSADYTTNTKRIRLRGIIPTGTKDALLAVDDVYAKTGVSSYTPSVIPFSMNSTDYTFDREKSAIYQSGTEQYTVEEFKSMLSTDANIKVYGGTLKNPDDIAGPASIFTTLKGDSDNIELGDIVVLTQNDGTIDNTLSLLIQKKPILKSEYNFDDKDLTVKPTCANTTATSGKVSGLYLKDSTDNACLITSTASSTAESVATRLELNKIDSIATQLIGKEKTTIEFSMAADGNYNFEEIHFMFTIPDKINKKLESPIKVYSDGTITKHDGKAIGKISGKKEWIRVGITFDPVECICKAYVNGKLVDSYEFFDDFDKDNDTFTVNRLSASINTPGIIGTTATLALDDITIYSGDYSYEGALTTPDKASFVSGKIYRAVDTYEGFMDSVSVDVGATKSLYEFDGDAFTLKNDSVNEGDVLVITSPDKIIKEYYIVSKKSELVVNNNITINPEISSVTASANANFFKLDDSDSAKAVFILAIYQGNSLVDVRIDNKVINTDGKVEFSAVHNSKLENGMSARAFLWDSFESIKPYNVDTAFMEIIE